jgi:RHH-type rel operon transcriptional repressor/antitoxin RelB
MIVSPCGVLPTLPPIARHLRAQAQVLNHDVLIALVARAGRRLRPHNDRRVNRQLVQLAAATAARLLARRAFVAAVFRPAAVRCLVHTGRLVRRTRRQFLQPRKLILDRLMFRLQLRQSPPSFSFSARRRPTSPIKSRTTPIRSAGARRSSESGTRVAIPSLNHIFESLTPPLPGNLPRLPVLYCKPMHTDTFSLRPDRSTKAKLEKLAKSTGRSRAYLAATAIEEYLDINEWQVAGIMGAIASLERGKGIRHERVQDWVASWETRKERRAPKSA